MEIESDRCRIALARADWFLAERGEQQGDSDPTRRGVRSLKLRFTK